MKMQVLPHDFNGKFGEAQDVLKRAPEGTGIIAGGPARSSTGACRYSSNIRTKCLGSRQQTERSYWLHIEGLKSAEDSGRSCKTSWKIC